MQNLINIEALDKNNINSIFKDGLLPKICKNYKNIELIKKYFLLKILICY